MASGMGMPSMGIYSYELFKFYDVKNIIRIGTAGAYTKDLNLYDILLVKDCYSDSNYALCQSGNKHNCIACEMESFALFHNAKILNKNATCLLTISDNLVTKEETSSKERQVSLNKMIEIALETITKL